MRPSWDSWTVVPWTISSGADRMAAILGDGPDLSRLHCVQAGSTKLLPLGCQCFAGSGNSRHCSGLPLPQPCSIWLDIGSLDGVCKFCNVRLDDGSEFCGSACHGLIAIRNNALSEVCVLQHLSHCALELIYDSCRSAGGRQEAVPCREFVSWQARFLYRGYVGRRCGPACSGNGNRTQFSCPGLRQG